MRPVSQLVIGMALAVGFAADPLMAQLPTLERGPYLQQSSDSRIVIRWRTDIATDSTVIFGQAAELTGGASQSPAAESLNGVEHLAELTTEHELLIEGLSANTRYYYAIGHGLDDAFVALSGGDASHYFDTASSPGVPKPTRIWAIGDGGDGGVNMQNVRDSYLNWTEDTANGGAEARHTELWLLLGDNAYPHGTQSQYQSKFFDVHQELLKHSTVWPTPGNHELFDSDTQSFPYFDIFSLPTGGESGGVPSGTESYYSFDYANIHLVSLDSATYPAGGLELTGMLEWLDADLAATDRQWIIVFFHHPPYSKGSHDSDEPTDSSGRLFDMRTQVLPILESYGVDLVLSGHSHSYERSFLIDGHHGDSSTYNPGAHAIDDGDGAPDGDGAYQALGPGTVYTVAGNASKRSTGIAEILNGAEGVPPHPVMSSSLWLLGSVVIDVDGNRLDATMIDNAGQLPDRFTMIKGAPPQPPQANFAAQPMTEGIPFHVQFTDLSQNAPTSWKWDFEDDGLVDSVEPNPTTSYTEPGLYSVRLTVSNSEGVDQLLQSDLICSTAGTPPPLGGLRIGSDKSSLVWDDEPLATAYDVARGDLAQVVASGGEFEHTGGCVDSVVEPAAFDPLLPGTDELFYYLVRGTNCYPQTGSYDLPTGATGQFASRDLLLQGDGGACACPIDDDDDSDGFCNAFDNCPQVADQTLLDSDADSQGDACDDCPFDALNDVDGDTICGDVDNCPSTANADQANTDSDLQGDACDPDDDGDGVPDLDDLAPLNAFACRDLDLDGCDDCASGTDAPNNDGVDIDGDGACDAFDSCVDVDQDGLGDGTSANSGCAHPISDSDDLDGDRCADVDGDGCDDCSDGLWNPTADGQDTDVDGICDLTDNCLMSGNPTQSNGDGDDLGDACDECTDLDGDGFGNLGYPQNICPLDNCPNVINPSQLDSDGDGKGDKCDICPFDAMNDIDFDFVCGDEDNCPFVNNNLQADEDNDGIGDVCDSCADSDQDGAGDPGHPTDTCPTDNCPMTPNPFQQDTDSDGLGNVCDSCPYDSVNDIDGDSVCGNLDNCPAVANPEQIDSDTDLLGDLCDADDDNDGVDDVEDCAALLPGVASTPGPIGATVRIEKHSTDLQLTWTRVAQGHLGNVYAVDGDAGETFSCVAADRPRPQAIVSATQRPGAITFYVVTPRNVCGEAPVAPITVPCADLALDSDNDSILDAADNCPLVANPAQTDLDGDWVGDLCDICPELPDPEQLDTDCAP